LQFTHVIAGMCIDRHNIRHKQFFLTP
jgi:hypothetical protein